jgi:alanyl aminopeptidase
LRTTLALIATLASLAAPVQGADAASELDAPSFRLPSTARPLRYALDLTVVPGDASARGEIAIDVELDRAHRVLWLNADSLDVAGAATELSTTRVSILSGHDQFVGLAFEPPLAAGAHRVTIRFGAEQTRKSTRGIFALEDGGAWYAMTQFEAVAARRAFPCFDEPGFKTPWQITLHVPRDLVAVSNTPVVSETPGADGLKTVRFAPTRPLPTYLVAFAVGPWQVVDLGRAGDSATPARIVVPRGRVGDAAFAADVYPELFRRLESWFGIAHPFAKLDHVAIPLTVNFAMENAGLITYGAPNLLAAPGAATPRFRRVAAYIGAHEISHQWFGNLVTLAWWDDIWLNEAFATWIAQKTVDRWRPDYERGAAHVDARARAIDADSLASARRIREPVASRGDIFGAFDRITYEKGATVIGMFERWIGEEPLRRGVRSYLESRSDGSATAADFLRSLTQASRLPVAPAFDTFLNQNGVPRVEVRLMCTAGGAQLALSQRRLRSLGSDDAQERRWQIPVCARYGTGTSSRQACALLAHRSQTVALGGDCPAFVFANAGGYGYYVPDYRDGALAKLARHRSALTSAELASLLHDLKALVRAGSVSSATALGWVRYGAAARERHVVLAALDLAEFAGHTLFGDAEQAKFSAFVRGVFGERARSLGFVPSASENDDDALMRRELLRVVAPHDPALAAQARRLALAWTDDRAAIDPGLVDVVLVTAGRTGDAATFDVLLAEAKATQNRLDRRYLMMALFAFTEPALARKGMALLLDPAFDARESWTALYNGFYWNPARRATHDLVVANFDALAQTVGRDEPGRWPDFASGLCSEDDRADVERFWAARASRYDGADRALAETLESIRVCARVRAHASAAGRAR